MNLNVSWLTRGTKGLFIAALFLFVFHSNSYSACSKVSMEIPQTMTIERVAFDAKMVITNNIPDKDLSNINVDVTIKDANGNMQNNIFFMRVTSLNGMDAVDGTGTVKASTTGEVHWLIIPSPGAGGASSAGLSYMVGATLTYTVDGQQEVVSVNPATITVKPEAQLIIDYFLPYEVLGDNPYTSQVEPPVPFPLAVRILNSGYGPATNLKIDSAQPKITSNNQGLLVDFKLLDSAVNDAIVSPSLTLNIGTLNSFKVATAYWDMISTLSGKFEAFNATFSHASDLGGDLTSVIEQMNKHYFVHRVRNNLPGRDAMLDILAYTGDKSDHLPDTIFESEIPGNTGKPEDAQSPVTTVQLVQSPARPTPQESTVAIDLATGDTGWVYAKLDDPAKGMLPLRHVIRTDGVHLDPNNFWINEGLDTNYNKIFTLNLLDYRADGNVSGSYSLVYDQPVEDIIPPITTLVFDGPSKGINPVYVTPATRIIFTATDNAGGSGVDLIMKKEVGVDTAGFVQALPGTLTNKGNTELRYYSVDMAGNQEVEKSTSFFVQDTAPVIVKFIPSPVSFTPQAPKGVSATTTMNFVINATDDITSLQATIDIASGSSFTAANIIRTLTSSVTSNTDTQVVWDGKDKSGALVPTGPYTARLTITDGLGDITTGHASSIDAGVTVDDWFKGQALDPNAAGAQQYPKTSGTKVVWQDMRNGNWDIYAKDLAGGSSKQITTNIADQTHPSISGNIVVWQDNRNGNWDIYGYDLSTGQEFPICTDPGDQELPVISGDWVVWQDNSAGDWDIYAYNLTTKEKIPITSHVTSHERDQMHPSISGNVITWEDYRHGLGEIYSYDLNTRTETRVSSNINNQTLPAVSGSLIVWTDQRNTWRDIYFLDSTGSERRVTYGPGDHTQAAIQDGLIVYTDYEAGQNDPNLSFFDLNNVIGGRLTSNPFKQESPAIGTGYVVWQDDRDGIYQIYWSNFQTQGLPIQVEVRPGFNLVAVGDKLTRTYANASDLVSAGIGGVPIQEVVTYNSLNNIYVDTSIGGDIPLVKGMGIGVYTVGSGTIEVGDSGETAQYTLLPGVNYIGMLSVPYGYSAYNLLISIGGDNIVSVRRFNNQTGAWETAAVRTTPAGNTPAGVDFPIQRGDGLIITMAQRVDGWKP